jgi:anhydro-N-acetylmuramic acid kinase
MLTKNKISVLGLMSGTSVDGLDIVFCDFELINNKWVYNLKAAKTYSYSAKLKAELRNAEHLPAVELLLLSNKLAKLFGNYCNHFLKGRTKPDIISSHGHTIFHQPEKSLTFQIANGAVIAATTGIKTICDFRTSDVAFGGQGAPLVPIGDKYLFSEYDFCLNIGGFANLSFIYRKRSVAYDICGVNLILNYLCSKLKLEFDKGGALARKGSIIEPLLKKLNSNNYFKKPPPKSLGKEWLVKNVFPLIDNEKYSIPDLLATYTEHCAIQISKCITNKASVKVLLTGGGAKNIFLLERIRAHTSAHVMIPDEKIIDFKEALIFAFLGVLRLNKTPNSLKSVTGASKDAIGGAIYCP